MLSPLTKLRLNNKLTVKEFYKKSGLSTTTITAIEHGTNRTISTNVLCKLNNVFQIDIVQFLEEYLTFYAEKQKERT